MKVLLIGNTGQLGWDLEQALISKTDLIALDFPYIDLTKTKDLSLMIKTEKPQVIINAAAYTNVDEAEREKELAMMVNGSAPAVIAEEARSLGALFIHYSTDYVFDGKKRVEYQELDLPSPINYYGETKLAGEQAVQKIGGDYYIFRTSWLYSTRKPNFLTRVLNWSRENRDVNIVMDQIGSPTWSKTLAETTVDFLFQIRGEEKSWRATKSRTYHLAGNGAVSRYEWARKILELDPNRQDQTLLSLNPVLSKEFPTAARRPVYSALDCSSFQNEFGLFETHWVESLKIAMSFLAR